MPQIRKPRLLDVVVRHLFIWLCLFSSDASSPCCRVPILRSRIHGNSSFHVRFSSSMNSVTQQWLRNVISTVKCITDTATTVYHSLFAITDLGIFRHFSSQALLSVHYNNFSFYWCKTAAHQFVSLQLVCDTVRYLHSSYIIWVSVAVNSLPGKTSPKCSKW